MLFLSTTWPKGNNNLIEENDICNLVIKFLQISICNSLRVTILQSARKYQIIQSSEKFNNYNTTFKYKYRNFPKI